MAERETCPRCGSALPPDAPRGLCPECLLEAGLSGDSDGAPDPGATVPVAPADSHREGPDSRTRADGAGAESGPAAPGARIRYFGDYELLEEIARGGMGVVYKARQVSLDRVVCVKLILAGELASEVDIARFRREAEAAAQLKHPNIVAIHEVGEHEGQYYFSMDYVEGKSLAELVRAGPLPSRRAAAIVKTIAEAVDYAHARGILHRDLKPSNILVDRSGEPHVTDFGLAKRAEDDVELTASGALLGTPSYMPPEQASGQTNRIGAHSDVYSLGVILYELLTGRPPFLGASVIDTVRQVLEDAPQFPSTADTDVPPDLRTVCAKCLEKPPEQRYSTAREFADELGRFLAGEPVRARPPSPFRRVLLWTRRHPGRLAALAAFLILALAAGVYYLVQENALLRALQRDPDLERTPGPLLEGLETWYTLASIVGATTMWLVVWILRRTRGSRARPEAERKRAYRPLRPMGRRTRAVAVFAGVVSTVLALVMLADVIEVLVWERSLTWYGLTAVYLLGWSGLWLLALAVADYRRGLLGTPPRELTPRQEEAIESALLENEVRRATSLYREAVPEAEWDEALAYVVRAHVDLRTERPGDFAPRRVNWRYLGICAGIEAIALLAIWFAAGPFPAGSVIACVVGLIFMLVLGGASVPLIFARSLAARLVATFAVAGLALLGGIVLFVVRVHGAYENPAGVGILLGLGLACSAFTSK